MNTLRGSPVTSVSPCGSKLDFCLSDRGRLGYGLVSSQQESLGKRGAGYFSAFVLGGGLCLSPV